MRGIYLFPLSFFVVLVHVNEKLFADITPAQARVAISNAAPLASFLRPLLARPLDEIIAAMQQMFPPLRHRRRQRDLAAATNSSVDVLIRM